MRPRRRHRKLLWPVGLSTLAIVPLVFAHHLASRPEMRPKYGIEVAPAPSDWDGRPAEFINWYYEVPPSGRWDVFEFAESETDNSLELIRLQQHTRSFMLRREAEKGIRIRLDRRMAYNDFVQIMDILRLENVNPYSFYDSAIWVYRFPRLGERIPLDHYPGSCWFRGDPPFPRSAWSKMLDKHQSTMKQCRRYWEEDLRHLPIPIMLILLGSFALNLYQIHKRHRVSGLGTLPSCQVTGRDCE